MLKKFNFSHKLNLTKTKYELTNIANLKIYVARNFYKFVTSCKTRSFDSARSL